MRTPLALALSALLASLPLAGLACGGGAGGGAAGGPTTPGNPASSAAPTSDATAMAPADAGPTTTTTTTLGAGGDLQGAKLTTTTTVASTTGSAAPPPTKGPHTHEPGRGPADLRAIVVAHRDEARACYDAALRAHPGIKGDLLIQWTIDPKGNVTQVSQDTERSQITEPGVVACVGNVIKKILFAPSPGGYETKAFYPFNFQPRQSVPGQGTGTGTP
ncbi:MAG TPA: AgmX/PglI C-terminal domain-containing protein [Polyangiaceae bacterium]|jgi:hypothetical protein